MVSILLSRLLDELKTNIKEALDKLDYQEKTLNDNLRRKYHTGMERIAAIQELEDIAHTRRKLELILNVLVKE